MSDIEALGKNSMIVTWSAATTLPVARALGVVLGFGFGLVACGEPFTTLSPTACIPSASAEPVDDDCGVFVSSSLGEDGAKGTKSAPIKTLQQAIDRAEGKRVYACAEELSGSVTLASGIAIHGGLDCKKGWAYVGATKKSTLLGEADEPALILASAANGAEVVDFTIQATKALMAGGSAKGGTLECKNKLGAGGASAGSAGTATPAPALRHGRAKRKLTTREVQESLSANVRRLRREASLSVTAAAERVGMSRRHWQKIEAAEVNVTLQTLVRLGAALGVDPAELFGGDAPSGPAAQVKKRKAPLRAR